jgi:hypothetical protein
MCCIYMRCSILLFLDERHSVDGSGECVLVTVECVLVAVECMLVLQECVLVAADECVVYTCIVLFPVLLMIPIICSVHVLLNDTRY